VPENQDDHRVQSDLKDTQAKQDGVVFPPKPEGADIPVKTVEEDPKIKAEGAVRAAKIGVLGTIIATMITATATFFVGIYTAKANEKKPATPIQINLNTVPPATNVKQVQDLPEDPDDTDFETLRDVSVFDLRGWKRLAPNEQNPRSSPANYINYLHVKKIRPAKLYKAHYHTSGSGIDLRCMTHSFEILEKQKPEQHAKDGGHEYEMDVNVEDMPVGKEFLVVIEATYWNSFQGLAGDDASTYTDTDIHQMQELSLFVLLPDTKPFKEVDRLAGPTGSEKQGFRDEEKFYQDKDHRFFYWDIIKRQPNYHYQAKWSW
jgi:hypothetical protein